MVIHPTIVVQEFLAEHLVTCRVLHTNVAFKGKILLLDIESEKIVDN